MSPGEPLSPALVREHLSLILASPAFQANPRASVFLSHVAGKTIAGRQAEIKEATIGAEVFQRDPSYDTKSDPIVRSAGHWIEPAAST